MSLSLLDAARAGDRRALARLLSLVEQGGDDAAAVVDAAYPLAANTHVIGITGPPGVGKSTLAAALAAQLRRRYTGTEGERVAIVAVDPTSPRTGGALLGDRVRMSALHDDRGVFVRSLASRGAAGGLAEAALTTATVLAAAGFGAVLVETVGAGQGEIDVAAAADTTLLVLAPGLGDSVQALKAGIVEVADVIAVNQSDRAGADHLVADLTFARAADAATAGDWSVPIVKTTATTGDGVAALADALAAHRAWRATADTARALPQRLAETLILRAAAQQLVTDVERRARDDGRLPALAAAVATRRLSPATAARRLLDPPPGR